MTGHFGHIFPGGLIWVELFSGTFFMRSQLGQLVMPIWIQAAITVSGAAKVLSRLPRFICGPSRYLAAGDCTSVNRKGWEFIWVGAQRMSSYAWAITAGLTVWVENVL